MSTEKESEHTHTYTGRVKWFNNKAGYGFVSITDGDKAGTDVFVHHSNVVVSSEQYKYLVQGEYVSFSMVRVEGDKHEFQAHNVTGVNGGTLMCETRYQQRVERSTYRKSKTQENEQDQGQEQNQWNYVSRVKKGNTESKPKATEHKPKATETQAPREKQPPRATESKPENQEKKKRGRPPSKKQVNAN
jgi:CspA family cold shock protein